MRKTVIFVFVLILVSMASSITHALLTADFFESMSTVTVLDVW